MSLKLNYNITEWPFLGLNYFAITKVGNTSMKYCLVKAEHPEKLKEIENEADDNRWLHAEDLAKYIDKETAKKNGLLNFTIIRNPFDRFYAMYDDFVHKRPQLMNLGVMSFADFAEYIAKTDDSFQTNVHFRSQWSFISDKGELIVDNLLNLDDNKGIEDWVKEATGVEIKYPHLHQEVGSKVEWTEDIKSKVLKRYEKDFELMDMLYGKW
jgi:hypothetical protein